MRVNKWYSVRHQVFFMQCSLSLSSQIRVKMALACAECHVKIADR